MSSSTYLPGRSIPHPKGKAGHETRSRNEQTASKDDGFPVIIPGLRDGDRLREELPGASPIVIVGWNGSGKTRLAVEIAEKAELESDFIPGLRPAQITKTLDDHNIAELGLIPEIRARQRSEYYNPVDDTTLTFQKYYQELQDVAIDFREAHRRANMSGRFGPNPENTRFDDVREIWTQLFPGKDVALGERAAWAEQRKTDHGEPAEEAIQRHHAITLGHGERVALYLIARILDSNKRLYIVDEPEGHLHNRVAVSLWDLIEDAKPESRFVYVTHDLQFALSRRDATYIVMKGGTPEISCFDFEEYSDIATSLLSVATLSISTKHVVFCEGVESGLDHRFYSAWFSQDDTKVVPVEGCDTVKRCVSAFRSSKLVVGLDVRGIVDSDDSEGGAPNGVTILDCYSIDNLIVKKQIFANVAHSKGLGEREIEEVYNSFLEKCRKQLNGGGLERAIAIRVRERFLSSVGSLLGKSIKNPRSISERLSSEFESQCSTQDRRLRDCLNRDDDSFLDVFSGKGFPKLAAETLKISPEEYIRIVCEAVRGCGQGELGSFLSGILPDRRLADT